MIFLSNRNFSKFSDFIGLCNLFRFLDRLDDLNKIHRALESSPAAAGPVQIPGDPERGHMTKCDELGGIPYHQNVVNHMNNLGIKHDVAPMPFTT